MKASVIALGIVVAKMSTAAFDAGDRGRVDSACYGGQCLGFKETAAALPLLREPCERKLARFAICDALTQG